MEYKSAEEYIKSDKFKNFHKERKERKSANLAKSKALHKAKGEKKEHIIQTYGHSNGNSNHSSRGRHGIL